MILEKLEGLSDRHSLKIQRPWFSSDGQREVTLGVLKEYVNSGGGAPSAPAPHAASHAPGGSDPLTGYAPGGVVSCTNWDRFQGAASKDIVLSGFSQSNLNASYQYIDISYEDAGQPIFSNGTGQNLFQVEQNFFILSDSTTGSSWRSIDGMASWVLDNPEGGDGIPVTGSGTRVLVQFEVGQIISVIDQGNRIEQRVGEVFWTNDGWAVLRNTVELTLFNASTFPSDTLYIGNLDVTYSPYVGWVDPDAITVTPNVPFDLGNILIDTPYGQNLNFGAAYGDIPWQRVSVPYITDASLLSIPIHLPPRARLTIAIRDYSSI